MSSVQESLSAVLQRKPQPQLIHQIPQRVHQIWWQWGDDGTFDDASVPVAPGLGYRAAWHALNPNYTFHMWRQEHSYALVRDNFPQLWPMFANYPRHIQRCDMFRLMLVALFGGVYSDIDVIPYRAMDAILGMYPKARVFFGVECEHNADGLAHSLTHPIRGGVAETPTRIANYWMASVPGHPIFEDILQEMQARAELPVREDYDVLYTTGPDVVSTVLERVRQKYDDVVVLSSRELWVNLKHVLAQGWRQDAEAVKKALT